VARPASWIDRANAHKQALWPSRAFISIKGLDRLAVLFVHGAARCRRPLPSRAVREAIVNWSWWMSSISSIQSAVETCASGVPGPTRRRDVLVGRVLVVVDRTPSGSRAPFHQARAGIMSVRPRVPVPGVSPPPRTGAWYDVLHSRRNLNVDGGCGACTPRLPGGPSVPGEYADLSVEQRLPFPWPPSGSGRTRCPRAWVQVDPRSSVNRDHLALLRPYVKPRASPGLTAQQQRGRVGRDHRLGVVPLGVYNGRGRASRRRSWAPLVWKKLRPPRALWERLQQHRATTHRAH